MQKFTLGRSFKKDDRRQVSLSQLLVLLRMYEHCKVAAGTDYWFVKGERVSTLDALVTKGLVIEWVPLTSHRSFVHPISLYRISALGYSLLNEHPTGVGNAHWWGRFYHPKRWEALSGWRMLSEATPPPCPVCGCPVDPRDRSMDECKINPSESS